MEKAENVLLVKGNFGWSDMGRLGCPLEVLEKDETAMPPMYVVVLSALTAGILLSTAA